MSGRLDVDGTRARDVCARTMRHLFLRTHSFSAPGTTQSSTAAACVTAAPSVRPPVNNEHTRSGVPPRVQSWFGSHWKVCLGPSCPALIGKMEPFVMLKLGDREYRTRACKGAWVHTDTARVPGGGVPFT